MSNDIDKVESVDVEVISESELQIARNAPKSMTELADLLAQGEDITQYIPSNSVDNMRAFMISYIRSRVHRVIKTTQYLEDLEDRLYEQVMKHNMPPSIIMNAIGTINSNLQATIAMMKNLTSDENYMNLIISQTNNIVQNNNIHRESKTVLDKESRGRVLELANSMLGSIDNLEYEDSVSEHTKSQVAKLLEEEDNEDR